MESGFWVGAYRGAGEGGCGWVVGGEGSVVRAERGGEGKHTGAGRPSSSVLY